MEALREMFSWNFLSRNSVYMSLLVGLTCPLVGVYLLLRRLVFMGVALPQISSCGIAFAFALEAWHIVPHSEGSESVLAFAGSSVFALGAILLFSLIERRGRGLMEGSLGTAYVLAGAWSILLLVNNPFGEHGLLDRLKGQIISVLDADLIWTGCIFGLVLLMLFVFRKEFLLVSFDREMAVTLKKNVGLWDSILFVLIGLTISMAVLSVGPLVTFGFLLVPPLIAHLFARNMRQFALAAAGIGGISSLIGFYIAYRWDYPVGPTDVALLGIIYGLVFMGRKLADLLRSKEIDSHSAGPA